MRVRWHPRSGDAEGPPIEAASAEGASRALPVMKSVAPELARSALDAAPDAMIIIDGAGVIRFANRQLSSIFGYHNDEIIGRPVELLMPERFCARHVAHRHQYTESVRIRP